MLPVVIAFGIISGLVAYSVKSALGPSRNEIRERALLVKLRSKPSRLLTLDEAEDGKVLARRYKEPTLEKAFSMKVDELRKRREPV